MNISFLTFDSLLAFFDFALLEGSTRETAHRVPDPFLPMDKGVSSLRGPKKCRLPGFSVLRGGQAWKSSASSSALTPAPLPGGRESTLKARDFLQGPADAFRLREDEILHAWLVGHEGIGRGHAFDGSIQRQEELRAD